MFFLGGDSRFSLNRVGSDTGKVNRLSALRVLREQSIDRLQITASKAGQGGTVNPVDEGGAPTLGQNFNLANTLATCADQH